MANPALNLGHGAFYNSVINQYLARHVEENPLAQEAAPRASSLQGLAASASGPQPVEQMVRLPYFAQTECLKKERSLKNWIEKVHELKNYNPTPNTYRAINDSAKNILAKINPANDQVGPGFYRLLNEMFLDVWTHGTDEQRNELIKNLPEKQLEKLNSLKGRVSLGCQSTLVTVLSSPVFKIAFAAVAFYYGWIYAAQLKTFLQVTLIPRAVIVIINNVPSKIIRIAGDVYAKRFFIWLGLILGYVMIPNRYPRAKALANRVQKVITEVIYLPWNLSVKLFWLPFEVGYRAGSYSFAGTAYAASRMRNIKNTTKISYYRANGEKARRIFMQIATDQLPPRPSLIQEVSNKVQDTANWVWQKMPTLRRPAQVPA